MSKASGPMSSPGTLSAWHRLDRQLARIRPFRERLSLLFDAFVIVLAWNATYLFRLGFERWLSARPSYDSLVLGGVVLVYLIVFWLARVPQAMWRFSGFGEAQRLTVACAIAGLISAVAVLMAQLSQIPRSVLVLHPVFALFGLCAMRIVYRMLYEHLRERITGTNQDIRYALVMGAGDAARLLLAGIHRQGWTVVGLLDDAPEKQGARLAGVPVLGRLEDVGRDDILAGVTHIVVAMPSASLQARRHAIELASATGLPVLTVPSSEQLRDGRAGLAVRDVEPEDVLGRDPVQLDEAGIRDGLSARTVLITGAGGSIGGELCRQVAACPVARLVLLEQSEFNLYSIEQELLARFPSIEVVALMGDVKDEALLERVWARWQPQVVFHAAAYKHVPMMETHNALLGLRNNTEGTYKVGMVSARHGVERVVLISTDKAVNPSNIMGATKRAAEIVFSALAEAYPATRFLAVRFGNVLGSSGSVIPRFKEQIRQGGPVTVTHPDIIRYFMTIPEAARLVLQAGQVGLSGQVLVLDMGEPVRIVDLARQLIRLSGHQEGEIRIVFTGLRPGEKLYEELLVDAETTVEAPAAGLRIAKLLQAPSLAMIQAWLEDIGLLDAADDRAVRLHLMKLVPEFRSSSSPAAS
ncbi:nucleoside-diphosphate sugar epimerase/dehydratase [Paucibacter sp. APW11]|uniref:Nucleoside-diphosphate sugar epimerase/dehydratase n=1 Tax=Roseateles aquae TaxID=3077235 RepID=A0ABU3PFW9_9BURK|nr:nucleoside-diphosphate sugar epimerase/dehydratase [Paucibacter sp. APW11]MDT9001242.1 nucleoside-diphosphate sugar epimerase/dehydratase [Paucibacter sp. APW11]